MANLLKKLTVAKDPLLDVNTSLLMGSTDVRGKDAGEKGKGFVPSDRLVLEEVSTCNVRAVVECTSAVGQSAMLCKTHINILGFMFYNLNRARL